MHPKWPPGDELYAWKAEAGFSEGGIIEGKLRSGIAMEHDVGKDGSGMARSKRIMIREVATLGIDIALG